MKTSKKLLAGAIASTLALSAVAPVTNAELSASATVASTYLWRGSDLGSGTPAVSGDLIYSASGAYAGVWASSGDTTLGTEYDLFIGYGGEVGDFSYDVSLWNYVYPNGVEENDIFDVADLVIGLGYGVGSFGAFIPVGDGSSGDYIYFTLGASFGDFGVTLGLHSDNSGAVGCPADTATDETCDPLHVNLDYAFNDSLSFTLSQFIADEPAGDDLKVVVTYSLPIE